MSRKSFSIKTKNLVLTPMTTEELESLAAFNEDEKVKESYRRMAELVSVNPKNSKWYTNWKIALREGGTVIGGAGFSGMPNISGETSMQCGILDYYRGNGYMAEAVGGLVKWAFSSDTCLSVSVPVKADADFEEYEILMSQSYRRELSDDGTVAYRIDKPASYNVILFSAFGTIFGLGLGLALTGSALLPTCIGLVVGFFVGFFIDILDRKKRSDAEAQRLHKYGAPLPEKKEKGGKKQKAEKKKKGGKKKKSEPEEEPAEEAAEETPENPEA